MTPHRQSYIEHRALEAFATMQRFGSVRLNQMPKVSLSELQEIEATDPKMLGFVRLFDYDDTEYKRSPESIVPARHPIIREIWVGARTLAAIGENDLPENMGDKQSDDEDTAELTELQTATYDDKPAWERWVNRQMRLLRGKSKEMVAARKELRRKLPKGKYDTPCYAMFNDPETGEYRPIMFGDVIQVAWGSNEDLDALYLEEASDPRSETDSLWRELTRDQVRANTALEDNMMPSTKLDKQMVGMLPRTVLQDSELDTPKPDEQAMWHEAHRMVEDLWRRCIRAQAKDSGEDEQELQERLPLDEWRYDDKDYRTLCDEAFDKVQRNWRKIAFDEAGKLLSGQFIDRMDFWDIVEENLRSLAKLPKKKAAPAPMDWNLIRGV